MTGGRFTEVDYDVLADYVGGALSGTPDEARVARLVCDDPAWARAHAVLAPAMADVRDTLESWGAQPLSMPVEVTDRLTAVLVDTAAATAPAMPTQATRRSDRRLVVMSRGHDRRRWSRIAAPVAVAAAVVGVAGLGISRLVMTNLGDSAASRPLDDSGEAVPKGARGLAGESYAVLEPGAQWFRASGTDYTPESLAGPVIPSGTPDADPPGPLTTSSPTGSPIGSASALGRLADGPALTACLESIATEHAQGPVRVNFLDYAAFTGQPALVVRFTDTAGDRWVWVVGPECGLPGSDADTLYSVRVG